MTHQRLKQASSKHSIFPLKHLRLIQSSHLRTDSAKKHSGRHSGGRRYSQLPEDTISGEPYDSQRNPSGF